MIRNSETEFTTPQRATSGEKRTLKPWLKKCCWVGTRAKVLKVFKLELVCVATIGLSGQLQPVLKTVSISYLWPPLQQQFKMGISIDWSCRSDFSQRSSRRNTIMKWLGHQVWSSSRGFLNPWWAVYVWWSKQAGLCRHLQSGVSTVRQCFECGMRAVYSPS